MFAKFYERHGDLPNARIIFDKATQVRKAGGVWSVWEGRSGWVGAAREWLAPRP